MKRLVLTMLVSWSGLVYFSASTHAASRESLRSVSQPGATLYQAAFTTKRLKGWTAPGGYLRDWLVSRTGVVSSPEGPSSELLAPYRLGSIRNFAVQATIKVTGQPNSHVVTGYGVVVRSTGTGSGGIQGGIAHNYRLDDTDPLLLWGSDSAGGAKATLHSGYNIYRLVVHNTDYTLLINDHQVVQFKITDARIGQRVGLWTNNRGMQVTAFTVSRLPNATALPSVPPVKSIGLGPADVPASLVSEDGSEDGHYYSTDELSRLDNVPISTIVSWGITAAYGVTYSPQAIPDSGPSYVDVGVNATTSPVAAQQQMARDWAGDQTFASKQPNYAVGDVTGLGDQARELSYDWSDAYEKITTIDIFFTRGSYDISLSQGFIQGTVSRADMVSQTLALAKIMDQRARQAG